MNRNGHEETVYFIGPEVENTPAYSKKTLFVVGIQDAEQVIRMAREYKTPHVFLGANHSFDTFHYTDHFGKTWNELVTALLDKGFWVTLDYPAHQHETVLKMLSAGVWQSRQFVPLLSVRIPNVETSSVNLTIKIDDIDFAATNRGVWCMNFHEITDSNRFTDWQDYATDKTISPLAGPAVTLPLKVQAPQIKVVVAEEVRKELEGNGIDVDAEIAEAIKNDSMLGLDIEGTSKLKPDPDAEVTSKILDVVDAESAAEAYAIGATADPLSAPAAKKPKAKKETV